MDFLIAVALVTLPTHVSFDSYGQEVSVNEAYCQNLYWQPNAMEKMLDNGCDVDAVSAEITRVRSGKY